jgi:general stress protein 26
MTLKEENQHVYDIVEKNPVCMFTVRGKDAPLLSRPMTVAKTEDDGEMWIFTTAGSDPATEVGQEAQVNLSFSGKDEWLSIHGSAVVITSEPKARELWNKAVDAFFPDGPESKNLALIRVRPEGAEYWTSPGGPLSTAFHWAKARLTGSRVDAGESATVEL